MKNRWEVHRMTHIAEIVWIVTWLCAGVVVLLGMNANYGGHNLWQIVFGFLG